MRKMTLMMLAPLLLSGCLVGVEGWDRDASYTTFRSSESSQNEQRLDAKIELNVGQLLIEAGQSGTSYDIDLYYDENAFEPKLDFRRSGEEARLDFDLDSKSRVNSGLGKTRLNLKLDPDARLELDAQTGVAESEIDLSSLKIVRLHLESGVGETKVFSANLNTEICRHISVENGVGTLKMSGLGNLNFERMEFQGGIGAAELEFGGDWQRDAQVDIDVGIGAVEIVLPRSIGAEVRMSKSWLSAIDIRGFRKNGSTYTSDNMDRVSRVVRININTGIGGVEVRWR